jgi:hypothetical protein
MFYQVPFIDSLSVAVFKSSSLHLGECGKERPESDGTITVQNKNCVLLPDFPDYELKTDFNRSSLINISRPLVRVIATYSLFLVIGFKSASLFSVNSL